MTRFWLHDKITIGPLIDDAGNMTNDDSEMANILNMYFQDDQTKADQKEDEDSDDERETILDAVKQHQAEQDSCTCLMATDMAAQVVINNESKQVVKKRGEENLVFAPGEGKIPTNIMREKIWMSKLVQGTILVDYMVCTTQGVSS